jgi:hypothetical protein
LDSDRPVIEEPVDDERENPDTAPTEDNPEVPTEPPPDVPAELPDEDLPSDGDNSIDDPAEPGSGLPEIEFLFFLESNTGLEIVTKIREADLERLSYLISDEQVAQIFSKFSEDPDWQAFVASLGGGDRTASELIVSAEATTVYEIELVGSLPDYQSDYGI